MNDLIPRTKKEYQAFKLPEKCGVIGCNNPCDIYIKHRGVARCAEHYRDDIETYGKHRKRGSATKGLVI